MLVGRGAVLLVAVSLAAGACGGDQAAEPAPPVAATTAAGGGSTLTTERTPAPDIRGRTLDGTPIRLADFRGQAVIVHLWSSW